MLILCESMHPVTCRIGSLETEEQIVELKQRVTCRIGSLEMSKGQELRDKACYLPNRQLRKSNPKLSERLRCYLPNRQLRNFEAFIF